MHKYTFLFYTMISGVATHGMIDDNQGPIHRPVARVGRLLEPNMPGLGAAPLRRWAGMDNLDVVGNVVDDRPLHSLRRVAAVINLDQIGVDPQVVIHMPHDALNGNPHGNGFDMVVIANPAPAAPPAPRRQLRWAGNVFGNGLRNQSGDISGGR